MNKNFRFWFILAGFMLILAACSGDDDSEPTSTPVADEPEATATATDEPESSPTAEADEEATEPSAAVTPETTATADVTTTPETTPTAEATAESGEEIPETPVGNQLTWILDLLNGEADLPEDEFEDRFAPEFTSVLPYAEFTSITNQVTTQYGPFSFTGFAEPPTDTQAVAEVLGSTGEALLLAIAVQPQDPNAITFLQIAPASALDTTPAELANWEDFDAQLGELAAQVSFQAAELGDDVQPVHALNADQSLAIGSAFKLYILGELGRQIDAGELTWDDELAIREEWKSLPSGIMQEEAEGAIFTLREYAELMISISDNTATDHLLFHLGREQVEAMQAEMGHSEPERNIPMLATREMFALKLGVDPEVADRYVAATDEEQRQILENEVAQAEVSLADAATWTEPRFIDTIEWFATAEDLTNAMASLRTMAGQPGLEPIMDFLAINPGMELDPQVWSYTGFKGGSEPGVLNMTWLLERADGRWFVLTVTLNDESNPIDGTALLRLMGGAAQLLAETP